MLRAMLSIKGLVLKEAANGKQAVDMALSFKPDLILMDLLMPEMDGCKASEIISNNPELKDTGIIAISASVFGVTQQESLKHGCKAFISKPVDMEKLFTHIKQILKIEWIYKTSTDKSNTSSEVQDIMYIPERKYLKILLKYSEEGDIMGLREMSSNLMNDSKYKMFGSHLYKMAQNLQLDNLDHFLLQSYEKSKSKS